MLICLFAKRPRPAPTLIPGLNYWEVLPLSLACVFPAVCSLLVNLFNPDQAYHPTERASEHFERWPVFLQLVFMELV